MALKLDEKVGLVRLNQFASQIEYLDPKIKSFLEESFSGKHSKEFYEGLLAAYANMHVMVNGLTREQLNEYSGPIVAFVANRLKTLEEVKPKKDLLDVILISGSIADDLFIEFNKQNLDNLNISKLAIFFEGVGHLLGSLEAFKEHAEGNPDYEQTITRLETMRDKLYKEAQRRDSL